MNTRKHKNPRLLLGRAQGTHILASLAAACSVAAVGILTSLAPIQPAAATTLPSPSATAQATKGSGGPVPSEGPQMPAKLETLPAPAAQTTSPAPIPSAPPATSDPNPNPDRSGITPLSEDDEAALRVEMGLGGAYMGAGIRAASTSSKRGPSTGLSSLLTPEAYSSWMPPGIQGMDVSGWQTGVNWASQFNQGARFAYVKATESTTYTNEQFASQYTGSRNAGMIRGAYHFATPSTSSGAAQARYFVSQGGGWSADGMTLPPLLDIEYNPYQTLGNTCYNMSASQMVGWIRDFSNTMVALTGRKPAIYTTTDWWKTCTANNGGFSDHPLHLASYSTAPGLLPNGWSNYSIWQYSSQGPFLGDSNVWNGTYSQLKAFAYGRSLSAGEAAISSFAGSMPVGAPVSSVVCGIRDNGCYQSFRSGEIFWSAATGAHASRGGAIRGLYRSLGAENSLMGYPTSEESCGLKNNGCYQMFQGGAVVWSPETGANTSRYGAIRDAYSAANFENGVLGYPTDSEVCGLRDGGCYQSFQNGEIHWSAKTGAQVSRYGAIRSQWAAKGFEAGVLGYPTSAEVCGLKNGGCAQSYQNGQIHWTSTTGAQMSRGGSIRSVWLSQNGEGGILGYPSGEETCGLKDNGCYQSFQGGQIHWTAKTGAQITRNGAIRNAWAGSGYQDGVLGYPTGTETCGLKDGGCYQSFQGGQVHWSPSSGANMTRAGAIATYWAQSGWENGPLGYPTGKETCRTTASCYQNFQMGTLDWTSESGVRRR